MKVKNIQSSIHAVVDVSLSKLIQAKNYFLFRSFHANPRFFFRKGNCFMCNWVFSLLMADPQTSFSLVLLLDLAHNMFKKYICVKENKFVGLGLKLSKIYLKSIRDTICSGVISTSNFQTGLSSILAQRSQKELTIAATAKWRTPFSGPTQRSCPSWARSWTHFDMLPIRKTHSRKIEFHLIETLCWKSF